MSVADQRALTVESRRLAVALVLGSVLATVALSWFSLGQYLRYAQALDSVEQRISRLDGSFRSSAVIADSLEMARTAVELRAYPAAFESSRAVADFQTRVREVLQGAGLTISGTQQFPGRGEGPFEELGLTVSGQGALEELAAALAGLDSMVPRPVLKGLRLQPVPARPGDEGASKLLIFQISVVALRIRNP